jgi:putative FmdB family regulatory protein
MPIYEYICDNCGHKFELLRKFGEAGKVNCTSCNSNARRIYSSVPFIFGGTRWVGKRKKETKTDLKDKSSDIKTDKTKIKCQADK